MDTERVQRGGLRPARTVPRHPSAAIRTATSAMSAPGWQTDELQDEWVDLDSQENDENDPNLSYGTHSLSLTAPLVTHIHTNSSIQTHNTSSNTSTRAAGTFLIREDVPNAPFLPPQILPPKTPNRKKGLMKDIFTPLPLERMFEPPSPSEADLSTHADKPVDGQLPGPSHIPDSGEDLNLDVPGAVPSAARKSSVDCQFTFAVPRELAVHHHPAAQSTPHPAVVFQPKPPPTDPRLRLFQFQYDTYTREHLSAMIDSIAINTPSVTGTSPSPTTFTHQLSRVSELTGLAPPTNVSHLRSAKRVKLSPLSDYYGEGAGSQAVISRPKLTGKDYVGESKHLMEQIKSARDFSTISTTVTAPNNSSPPPQTDPNEVTKAHVSPLTPSGTTGPFLCFKIFC